jgi:hypothetical protein
MADNDTADSIKKSKSNGRGGNAWLETEIFRDNRIANGVSICCGKRRRIVPDVNGEFCRDFPQKYWAIPQFSHLQFCM